MGLSLKGNSLRAFAPGAAFETAGRPNARRRLFGPSPRLGYSVSFSAAVCSVFFERRPPPDAFFVESAEEVSAFVPAFADFLPALPADFFGALAASSRAN